MDHKILSVYSEAVKLKWKYASNCRKINKYEKETYMTIMKYKKKKKYHKLYFIITMEEFLIWN